RAGVGISPYGGVAVGGSRTVVAGHATRYVSPVTLRNQAAFVRTGYHYPYFTPTWYRSHAVAWVAPRWRVPNFCVAPVWPSVAVYCGITAPPIVYDYGSSVVIDNNYIYQDGQQVATAQQYATQATQYADAGRKVEPPKDEEWQPLGVFGMIQDDEKVAQRIFQ